MGGLKHEFGRRMRCENGVFAFGKKDECGHLRERKKGLRKIGRRRLELFERPHALAGALRVNSGDGVHDRAVQVKEFVAAHESGEGGLVLGTSLEHARKDSAGFFDLARVRAGPRCR